MTDDGSKSCDYDVVAVSFAQGRRNQDRHAIVRTEGQLTIIVADGAGGMGDGAAAAETVIRELEVAALSATTDWERTLRQIDVRVAMGESTAVVVQLTDEGIRGASAGDSCAWIVEDELVTDLTRQQQRKPLLGSGNAVPTCIRHEPLATTLIVASDGFANYVKLAELTRVVRDHDLAVLPRRLVDLVRLRSGELWDDTTVVVCRRTTRRPVLKRYVLD